MRLVQNGLICSVTRVLRLQPAHPSTSLRFAQGVRASPESKPKGQDA